MLIFITTSSNIDSSVMAKHVIALKYLLSVRDSSASFSFSTSDFSTFPVQWSASPFPLPFYLTSLLFKIRLLPTHHCNFLLIHFINSFLISHRQVNTITDSHPKRIYFAIDFAGHWCWFLN